MNIDKLEVGGLYKIVRMCKGTKPDPTCVRSTCSNRTCHYQGSRQFRCSDIEGCGAIYTLTGLAEHYEVEEADVPGSNMKHTGMAIQQLPLEYGIDMAAEGTESFSASAKNPEEPNISIESMQEAMKGLRVKYREFLLDPVPLERAKIFGDIDKERRAQTEKWGEQSYPSLITTHEAANDLTKGIMQCFAYGLPKEEQARERYEKAVKDGTVTWGHIFLEEVCETFAATNEADMRKELIQALASGVQWLEDMDKKAQAAEFQKALKVELLRVEPLEFRNEYLGVPFEEEPCQCPEFKVTHAEPGLRIHQCILCQGIRRTHPECVVLRSAIKCFSVGCFQFANEGERMCADCIEAKELRQAVTVPAKKVTDPAIIKAIESIEAGEGRPYTLPEPCRHMNTQPHYNHVSCKDCGMVKTDSSRDDWGGDTNKWFEVLPKKR